jgi:hypothetical protein
VKSTHNRSNRRSVLWRGSVPHPDKGQGIFDTRPMGDNRELLQKIQRTSGEGGYEHWMIGQQQAIVYVVDFRN